MPKLKSNWAKTDKSKNSYKGQLKKATKVLQLTLKLRFQTFFQTAAELVPGSQLCVCSLAIIENFSDTSSVVSQLFDSKIGTNVKK